jgi:hypothetical protein
MMKYIAIGSAAINLVLAIALYIVVGQANKLRADHATAVDRNTASMATVSLLEGQLSQCNLDKRQIIATHNAEVQNYLTMNDRIRQNNMGQIQALLSRAEFWRVQGIRPITIERGGTCEQRLQNIETFLDRYADNVREAQ